MTSNEPGRLKRSTEVGRRVSRARVALARAAAVRAGGQRARTRPRLHSIDLPRGTGSLGMRRATMTLPATRPRSQATPLAHAGAVLYRARGRCCVHRLSTGVAREPSA